MVIEHKDCFYLGYVSKTQGFKGGMILFLDVDEPEHYADLDRVLIDMNGILTPFFIETIDLKDKNFASAKFEGVDDRDHAITISNKDLYLPLTDLPKLGEDEYYLHELVGMEVNDASLGILGKVDEVLDYSANTLIRVLKENNEILIPLQDEFILKVNKAEKIIKVNLPEGLIEINQS